MHVSTSHEMERKLQDEGKMGSLKVEVIIEYMCPGSRKGEGTTGRGREEGNKSKPRGLGRRLNT